MKRLPLDAIHADPAVQPRCRLDAFRVDEYAERMRAGDEFPPVVVFGPDAEGRHWLADGFHRHAAARQAQLDGLDVDRRPGGRREAVLHAVAANRTHGLPRTNADKRRAVSLLLADGEWARWSDRKIARHVGVSDRFVNGLRAELSANGSQMGVRRVQRGGGVFEMNTTRIGDSARLVPEARDLLRETGIPDDRREVARLSGRPPEVQVRAAELIAQGEARCVDAALKALNYEGKAASSLAELERGRWPVVYADPPWLFESGDGLRGVAGEHYPCMATPDICALPVGDHVAENAVLFLWTTAAHVFDAGGVIEAWGFRYRSQLAWMKPTVGVGHYVRGQHELLLLGIRGTFLPKWAPPSVIGAPTRGHSRKPAEVYKIIERMYPGLEYLELFARPEGERQRWTFWGNEVPCEVPCEAGEEVPA